MAGARSTSRTTRPEDSPRAVVANRERDVAPAAGGEGRSACGDAAARYRLDASRQAAATSWSGKSRRWRDYQDDRGIVPPEGSPCSAP